MRIHPFNVSYIILITPQGSKIKTDIQEKVTYTMYSCCSWISLRTSSLVSLLNSESNLLTWKGILSFHFTQGIDQNGFNIDFVNIN